MLAPYLADNGWDVSVYGRRGSTRAADPARDPRVRTIVTRGIERKSVSTLSYGLTATIDAVKRKPDVALVMNVANGYFLPLLRMRGVPTLVNVDGIEWDRAKWGRLAKGVFHTGARATARFGTRMVYDSREIARRWGDEFGLDGDFIPYGGDVPTPLPLEANLSHRGYVLLVARFVPENTVPEFLEAARALSQRWPVVIVGSSGYGGSMDDSAASLAEEMPNVSWLGHVSDDSRLLSLWQHAGVYFHGHSVGGTNPALVQAMAAGAPIVARDTPYNREVLASTGIFTLADPNSIAASINSLMSNPLTQATLGSAAQGRAFHHYSWEKVCQAYEQSLLALLHQRKREE
jgi:glycosyltransferase involved in cell wall biosynthesis